VRRWSVVAKVLLLAMASPAVAADGGWLDAYAELSLPLPTVERITVCHGFGCRFRTPVALDQNDRKRLTQLLAPGRSSPAAERQAIASAVAWFDRRVGPVAGVRRVARASIGQMGDPSQEDCIDASRNTTSLLVVLQELRLLRHHTVGAPFARGFLLDGRWPHATAVLLEAGSDTKWAVDAWTHAHGELPDVMPLARWAELR
jgi:hypothetical protein